MSNAAKGGSFRDLEGAKPKDNVGGVPRPNVGALGVGDAGVGGGTGNGAMGPLSNYSTFQGDPSVQKLLKISDRMEVTKRQIGEAEDTAKHVLVDLELQRMQLRDMSDAVTETGMMTSEAKVHLKTIADRAYRKKIFLWAIILLLAVTDIVVFYTLFIR